MKTKTIFAIAFALLALGGCKKKSPELGDPPTASDANFSYSESAATPNVLNFKASRSDVIAVWDFGNGTSGEGTSATGIYPNKGTYTVKLTIFIKGGSISSTKDVVITDDDLSLIDDPLIAILTGGIGGTGSRTWVVDSNTAAHFGVGPEPVGSAGLFPEYYAATANEKSGSALYDDRYTFYIDAFRFDMVTNGEVYINEMEKDNFPGSYESPVADYNAPYTDRLSHSWSLTTENNISTITISGDAFIGYYTGTHSYQVIEASDTLLSLRQLDANNGALAWYIRLIPEGHDSGGGGGGGGGGGSDTNKFTLPIDFETVEPIFEAFGGSTDTIVANPDPSGINTSSKVLETVHGHETWAGIFVDLKDPMDFSTEDSIAVKIYAPAAGTLRIKIEDSGNSQNFLEKDVNYSQANTWEEVAIQFPSSASGKYDRLVLFPGWSVPNAGTFYLDDIKQK